METGRWGKHSRARREDAQRAGSRTELGAFRENQWVMRRCLYGEVGETHVVGRILPPLKDMLKSTPGTYECDLYLEVGSICTPTLAEGSRSSSSSHHPNHQTVSQS